MDAYLTSVRYSRFTNETELVFPTPTVTEQFVEHPVDLKPVYFTPSPTATPVSTIYIPHEATTLHIAQPGSLAVTSTPSGAEVWVNGVDTGQTTLAMLAEDAGTYQGTRKTGLLRCPGHPNGNRLCRAGNKCDVQSYPAGYMPDQTGSDLTVRYAV